MARTRIYYPKNGTTNHLKFFFQNGQRQNLIVEEEKDIRDMQKVLFLCTGNSCRSQMAEAFLREFGKGEFEALSAGVKPTTINPYAVKVMSEEGIDFSGQESNPAGEYINETFDYVVTVCDNAQATCPTYPGDHKKLHWDLSDPADATGEEEEILQVFRRSRDKIKVLVQDFIERA